MSGRDNSQLDCGFYVDLVKMLKTILYCLVLAYSFWHSQLVASMETHTLDWRDRSPELKVIVNKVFLDLSGKIGGNWSMNGAPDYMLFNISLMSVVKLIVASNPEKDEFVFLDLGAGDFSCGDSLVTSLNDTYGAEGRLHFHVVSCRAEDGLELPKSEAGLCTVVLYIRQISLKLKNLLVHGIVSI
jgi:hypothetical protein